MPRRFRLVRFILRLLGFGLPGLVLGGWFMGRLLSDRAAWSQWLAWIPGFIPLLAALLLVVMACLLPKRRSSGAGGRPRRVGLAFTLPLFMVVAVWFTAVEHRWLRMTPTVDPHRPMLRIMHWTSDHPSVEMVDRFVDALLTQDAEINILSHPGLLARSALLRARYADMGGSFLTVNGFGVFTTLPVLRSQPILREDEIVLAFVELDTRPRFGRTTVIYLVDLPSEPRRSRVDIARRVRAALAADEHLPPADLVVGDFNIPRRSWTIGFMFPGFTHAFDQAGWGWGATFPRHAPWLHIDQMLLSPRWHAEGYAIVDPGFGRHALHTMNVTPRSLND